MEQVIENIRSKIPRQFRTPAHNGVDPSRRNRIDRGRMYGQLVANDLLRSDVAREIDETVLRVARRDLVGVADLRSFGLDTPTEDGVGTTQWEFENIGTMTAAQEHMSILALGDRDQVDYELHSVPVPVLSKPFQLDRRQQAASSDASGVNVSEATRKVVDLAESILVNGGSSVIGGNGITGYTNHGPRQTANFSDVSWPSIAGSDLSAIVTDVTGMRADLRALGFNGPYVLYVPGNYDGLLGEDYKLETDRTVRERILALEGIEQVKVLPSLADDNVLMVQMTESVVEMPVGQEITPVTWDIMGGLATNWAILGVLSFALKTARDENENDVAGISHLS